MKTSKSSLRKRTLPLLFFISTGLLPRLLMAQTTTTELANKALIRYAFSDWAAGRVSFFDLLSEDVHWTISGSSPLSKTYTSKQQFMAEVITPLNERLARKIVPTLRELYADGDVVIALWDGQATATDGKPYTVTYAWFMTLQQGRIVAVTAFLDTLDFADILHRLPSGQKN